MEKPIRTVRRDIPTLLRDAQKLMVEAAATSGEKAVELRARAQELMHEASVKTVELKESSKAALQATDACIRENPYKAMAVAAGVGLVIGAVFAKITTTGEQPL